MKSHSPSLEHRIGPANHERFVGIVGLAFRR